MYSRNVSPSWPPKHHSADTTELVRCNNAPQTRRHCTTFRRVAHGLALCGHGSLARRLSAGPCVRLEVEFVDLSRKMTRVKHRSAPLRARATYLVEVQEAELHVVAASAAEQQHVIAVHDRRVRVSLARQVPALIDELPQQTRLGFEHGLQRQAPHVVEVLFVVPAAEHVHHCHGRQYSAHTDSGGPYHWDLIAPRLTVLVNHAAVGFAPDHAAFSR